MDSKVEKLLRSRIALELSNSEERLGKEILDVIQGMSARGVLNSSMTAIQLSEVFRQEARLRIAKIWETMHRVITLSNQQISDEVTQDLSSLLAALVEEHTSTLPAQFDEKANKYAKGMVPGELTDLVAKEIDREHGKQQSELELFSLNFQSRTVATSGPVINVYGTAGSIQTGPDATANVNLQINSAPELSTLLQEIREDLANLDDRAGSDKSDLIEVVSEGIDELEKENPNKTKVRGLLAAATERFNQVDSALSGGAKIVEWGKRLATLLGTVGGFLG